MPISPDLRRRFNFFREHAGGWVGHTAESAISLARAERWFEDSGLEYSIEPDPYTDLSWMTDEERARPHECVAVCLRNPAGAERGNGYLPYSLCGIVDADQNYLRVVVAELASEALRDQQTAGDCWRW